MAIQTYRPAEFNFENAYSILQGATWEFQINFKSGGNPVDLSAYGAIVPAMQMRKTPLPAVGSPPGTPEFTPVCTWVNALLGQVLVQITAATSATKGWGYSIADGVYHMEIYQGAPGPAQIIQRVMRGTWDCEPEFVV